MGTRECDISGITTKGEGACSFQDCWVLKEKNSYLCLGFDRTNLSIMIADENIWAHTRLSTSVDLRYSMLLIQSGISDCSGVDYILLGCIFVRINNWDVCYKNSLQS